MVNYIVYDRQMDLQEFGCVDLSMVWFVKSQKHVGKFGIFIMMTENCLQPCHYFSIKHFVSFHSMFKSVFRIIKVQLCKFWGIRRVREKRTSPVVNCVARFPYPRSTSSGIDLVFFCSEGSEGECAVVLSNVFTKMP